jgi:hypothetical protein
MSRMLAAAATTAHGIEFVAAAPEPVAGAPGARVTAVVGVLTAVVVAVAGVAVDVAKDASKALMAESPVHFAPEGSVSGWNVV